MNNSEYWVNGKLSRVFKRLKREPFCSPDKISAGGSRYWFGSDKRGNWMIRKSDHWGKVGSSYYLLGKKTSDAEQVNLKKSVVAKTYLVYRANFRARG